MNEANKNRLQELIESGYEFHISDYISKGNQLLSKNMGSFIGFSALAFFVIMFAAFIPIGNWAVSIILIPAFAAGNYIVANKLDKGEEVIFNDFFKGFDFLGQLALVGLVVSIILPLVFFVPLGIYLGITSDFFSNTFETLTELEENTTQLLLLMLAVLIPFIYINVAYSWAYLFVVFYKMSFWEALETSRKLITRKWFSVFGLSFILGLIYFLGAAFFLVGLLFAIPLGFCVIYASFADVTKLLEQEDESDQIIDHLVG